MIHVSCPHALTALVFMSGNSSFLTGADWRPREEKWTAKGRNGTQNWNLSSSMFTCYPGHLCIINTSCYCLEAQKRCHLNFVTTWSWGNDLESGPRSKESSPQGRRICTTSSILQILNISIPCSNTLHFHPQPSDWETKHTNTNPDCVLQTS